MKMPNARQGLSKAKKNKIQHVKLSELMPQGTVLIYEIIDVSSPRVTNCFLPINPF